MKPLRSHGNKQEDGMNYFEVAALNKDSACWPDKDYMGSYFLSDTPVRAPIEAYLPLQVYDSEKVDPEGTKESFVYLKDISSSSVLMPMFTIYASSRQPQLCSANEASASHAE